MSTEAAAMNQRKRKSNFVPEAHNKRWRPDEVKSPTIKMHGQPSLLEEARLSKVTSSASQSGGYYSRMMEADSNTVNENDESDSEDYSSESELSSDTEMSSDSNISSSDSDDEGEDEDDEHVSSIGDATSDQDSLDDFNTISLPTQSKPAISNSTSMSDFSELHLRITTFLPQLREANEDLVNVKDDHRIDAVADDQDHYIEMDLGLGVLKEKPRRRRPSREIQTRETSSSSSVTTSSDSDSETEEPGEDVMRNLLGERIKREGKGDR
jgi:hypothetical protein